MVYERTTVDSKKDNLKLQRHRLPLLAQPLPCGSFYKLSLIYDTCSRLAAIEGRANHRPQMPLLAGTLPNRFIRDKTRQTPHNEETHTLTLAKWYRQSESHGSRWHCHRVDVETLVPTCKRNYRQPLMIH